MSQSVGSITAVICAGLTYAGAVASYHPVLSVAIGGHASLVRPEGASSSYPLRSTPVLMITHRAVYVFHFSSAFAFVEHVESMAQGWPTQK
jgi:hypothetical protein